MIVISTQDKKTPRTRPPRTPEEQQDHLISLAIGNAEKQLRDGTASSQIVTYFLKLASEKEKNNLELEKLREENKLLQAKTKAYESAENSEEMYKEAIEAMKRYTGNGGIDD